MLGAGLLMDVIVAQPNSDSARATRFLRFCAVGLCNTLLSLGIVWSAMHWSGLSATDANMAGYAIGILASFGLNRRWTFGATTATPEMLIRWAIICAAGYCVNLLALTLLIAAGMNGYLAQLPAMAAYTIVCYLGSKHYVFIEAAKS